MHGALIDTFITHPTRGGIARDTEDDMISLKVTGMTCGHCEAAVKKALEVVPGVTAVTRVDRNDQVAEVEGSADAAALVAAIVEEGYTAEVA
jgi:copper chaperone